MTSQWQVTFAGAIARRVHDHGMPVSQGELVRDMMDWFAGPGGFPAAGRTDGSAEGVSDLEGTPFVVTGQQ